MGIRLDESRLSTGMAGIADAIHPILQNTLKPRPVGIMARAACPLGKRHVGGFGFLNLACLRMTAEAQLSLFRDEDMLILGSVRSMAREATLSALNGVMGDRDFCRFLAVAISTELIAPLNKEGLVLRGMGMMTGEAHPALKGLMLNSAAGLQVRFVMARVAEFTPLFSRIKRLH